MPFVKRTLVTGVLVLVPVVFIGYLGFQLFRFARLVFEPVVRLMPFDSAVGWLLLNLAAIILVVLFCFVAGLLVRISLFASYFDHIDSLMTTRVPGYSIAKGIVGGIVQNDDAIESHRPVLVAFDGGQRLGFEVERTTDGWSVVYLPNAPNPQTGIAVAFRSDDVRAADVSRLRSLEILQFYGKGLADLSSK